MKRSNKFLSKNQRFAFRRTARSLTQKIISGASSLLVLGGAALIGAAGVLGAVSPSWSVTGLGMIAAGSVGAVAATPRLGEREAMKNTTVFPSP